jgi:hypothetical protein
MSDYRTRCCKAPFAVSGKGTTHWYVCTACGKPTGLPTDEEWSDEDGGFWPLQSDHAVAPPPSDIQI